MTRPSAPAALTLALLLSACAPGLRPSAGPREPAPIPERAPVIVSTKPTAGMAPIRASVPSALTEDVVLHLQSRELMVPVAGVPRARIGDTFLAKRSAGRVHHALDIMAPKGTPVLSADDGRVIGLKRNALGGITVWATDPERKVVYYYAHLDRWRDGLADGQWLRRGEVVGYVGTTGNADARAPHLHFQLMLWRADGRYWDGVAVDPRPFFAEDGSSR